MDRKALEHAKECLVHALAALHGWQTGLVAEDQVAQALASAQIAVIHLTNVCPDAVARAEVLLKQAISKLPRAE